MLGGMRAPIAVLALLAGLAGCADEGLSFTGELGRASPADVRGAVPVVTGELAGFGSGNFLLDSGAPLTLCDSAAFGVPTGVHELGLEAMGLSFAALTVASYDLATPWDGIVGGDILAHFALSVDYAGARVWLDRDRVGLPDGLDPSAVDPSVTHPAEVRGGGRFVLPCVDCGEIDVGATRLLVEVAIESGVTQTFLVDTGATAVVVSPELLDALGGTRPELAGVTVTTADGPREASYVRLGRVAVGASALTSVPALVVPDASFLAGLEAEVGRSIGGILGGSFLRGFAVTLDYPGRALALASYRDPDHIPADEFVDVGFTMASRDGVWEVEDVYRGTDAAAEGLETGERIVSIDGTAITGLDRSAVDALRGGFGLGDDVPVGVSRAGATVILSIAVEDLLPAHVTP